MTNTEPGKGHIGWSPDYKSVPLDAANSKLYFQGGRNCGKTYQTELQKLQAENARLREALTNIMFDTAIPSLCADNIYIEANKIANKHSVIACEALSATSTAKVREEERARVIALANKNRGEYYSGTGLRCNCVELEPFLQALSSTDTTRYKLERRVVNAAMPCLKVMREVRDSYEGQFAHQEYGAYIEEIKALSDIIEAVEAIQAHKGEA